MSMIEYNVPCSPYGKHVKFLSDKMGIYDGAALISCDLAMRQRGENQGMHTFCYGDHDSFGRIAGLENLIPKEERGRTLTLQRG